MSDSRLVSHGEQVKLQVPSAAPATDRIDRRALAAASVTVVLWASAFVAIRSGGRYFDPGALALGRLLAGSLVLGTVRTTAGKMGATTYVVPALVVVMSWTILGQTPKALGFLGGALCLAGVAVSRRRRRGG